MNKKTVLVTGASRGIGKAISMKFAQENYNIIINCVKNKECLNQVQSEIKKYGASCLSYIGDAGNYNNMQELFLLAKEQFGSIDVLINNAGISHIGLFQDISPSDWNNLLTTNLTSVYNCCHFAIPQMLTQKQGKIINISSVWGIAGASCEVAYSATKGAVNTLTKALAKELAPSNIQVNAVSCGAVDTQMNSFLNDEELLELTEEIPAGRLGRPEEIADFVYQLATSPSYLTGQVISMDGGWI